LVHSRSTETQASTYTQTLQLERLQPFDSRCPTCNAISTQLFWDTPKEQGKLPTTNQRTQEASISLVQEVEQRQLELSAVLDCVGS
jgi:uncharacterized protein with PIN domain